MIDHYFTETKADSGSSRGAFFGKVKTRLLSGVFPSIGLATVLACAGGIFPFVALDAGFKGYVSQASVAIKSSDGQALNAAAVLGDAHRKFFSVTSLGRAVGDLKLQADELQGFQKQTELGLLFDLLTGESGKTVDALNATEAALANSIVIAPGSVDSQLRVEATAATPQAALRIADYVAMRIIADASTGRAAPAVREEDTARAALDKAEGELTGFQMRHGNVSVSQMQALQQQIADIDTAVSALNRERDEMRGAMTSASAMKADDVFTKPLPSAGAFQALESVRQAFSNAKMALSAVSINYGPKHPRTIAAQNAVDEARALAAPAIKRVLDSLKIEDKQLNDEFASYQKSRSTLNKQLIAMGDAPAELLRLEAQLETTRRNYLAASEAETSGPSTPSITGQLMLEPGLGETARDMTISAASAAAGALAGLLLALFILSFRRPSKQETHPAVEAMKLYGLAQPIISPVEQVQPSAPTEEIEPDIFHDLEDWQTEALIEAQKIYVEEVAFEPRYDAPANDIPLDDQVRLVLMRNRFTYEEDQGQSGVPTLPPLLAAALASRHDHNENETAEVRALRQEVARLKERLQDYVTEQDDRRWA
jgi:uncharacterized protein involved in exopolysaccharide biosynthesis